MISREANEEEGMDWKRAKWQIGGRGNGGGGGGERGVEVAAVRGPREIFKP